MQGNHGYVTSSRTFCVCAIVMALAVGIGAQTSAVNVAPTAGLDVVSVKESHENVGGFIGIQPGGRIVMTNVRVRDFVNMVYSANPPLFTPQIIGLPPWASVIRYNIEAKFTTDGADNTFDGRRGTGPYVRAVLEGRFAFKAHLEKRELPVYLLTVTDAARLRPSSVDCSKEENQRTCWGESGPGHVKGALALSDLAADFVGPTERLVLDRTDLSGRFDFDVQWNPNPLDASDARPSIFGAVTDYGLKLESSRAMADVLVIDHVERPTED